MKVMRKTGKNPDLQIALNVTCDWRDGLRPSDDSHIWRDQKSSALKGDSQRKLVACLDSAACLSAWRALDERRWEWRVWGETRECVSGSACVTSPILVSVWMEERVHEVKSCQQFDFPSFPGKLFWEQCIRKTTNHRLVKCHKRLKNS